MAGIIKPSPARVWRNVPVLDFRMKYDIVIWCACRHHKRVSAEKIAAKYGIDLRMNDLQRRARCTSCRKRPAEHLVLIGLSERANWTVDKVYDAFLV